MSRVNRSDHFAFLHDDDVMAEGFNQFQVVADKEVGLFIAFALNLL